MKLLPTSPRIRQLAPFALILACSAVAVAAYFQTIDYPFVFDDFDHIANNIKLIGLHLSELWRLFIEPYNPAFEFLPLRELSYWFDLTLFGQNPSAFRMHNIILYLLSLPLVYATTSGIWRYFRPADADSAPWAAAAVTALFAVHPTLVEPVVWISGRKYVLPNVFSMLALWFAVSAKREYSLSPAYATATLIAFVAMMLSKTSYVTVAPVIALLWFFFWRDIPAPERRRSLLLWPLAILLLAAAIAIVFIANSSLFTPKGEIPLYFGIEVATRTLAVLGWLARLAVSPENRHFFYPVFGNPWLPAMVTLGVAVMAIAAWGAATILRKRSLEGFALVTFALLCLPYLQLIPYAPPSLVSDRFLSLAVWPIILLIVALAWRLKPVPRAFILLAIMLPWVLQTIERPRDWRSPEVMVDTELRTYPGHYLPVYQKVTLQLVRGLFHEASGTANSITTPELRDLMVKLVEADYAVNVGVASTGNPGDATTLLQNLGLILKHPPVQIKWDSPVIYVWNKCESVLWAQWNYLAKQFPDDVSVRYNAGLWMLDDHDYINAAAHLRAATESQRLPESVRGIAFKNLGIALMNSGYIAKAEAPLKAALEQSQPDLQAFCILSSMYKQTKRLEEAARAETECRKQAIR